MVSQIEEALLVMDIPNFITQCADHEIKTVEMHTTGEPTRIVYSGFPDLSYACRQSEV